MIPEEKNFPLDEKIKEYSRQASQAFLNYFNIINKKWKTGIPGEFGEQVYLRGFCVQT